MAAATTPSAGDARVERVELPFELLRVFYGDEGWHSSLGARSQSLSSSVVDRDGVLLWAGKGRSWLVALDVASKVASRLQLEWDREGRVTVKLATVGHPGLVLSHAGVRHNHSAVVCGVYDVPGSDSFYVLSLLTSVLTGASTAHVHRVQLARTGDGPPRLVECEALPSTAVGGGQAGAVVAEMLHPMQSGGLRPVLMFRLRLPESELLYRLELDSQRWLVRVHVHNMRLVGGTTDHDQRRGMVEKYAKTLPMELLDLIDEYLGRSMFAMRDLTCIMSFDSEHGSFEEDAWAAYQEHGGPPAVEFPLHSLQETLMRLRPFGIDHMSRPIEHCSSCVVDIVDMALSFVPVGSAADEARTENPKHMKPPSLVLHALLALPPMYDTPGFAKYFDGWALAPFRQEPYVSADPSTGRYTRVHSPSPWRLFMYHFDSGRFFHLVLDGAPVCNLANVTVSRTGDGRFRLVMFALPHQEYDPALKLPRSRESGTPWWWSVGTPSLYTVEVPSTFAELEALHREPERCIDTPWHDNSDDRDAQGPRWFTIQPGVELPKPPEKAHVAPVSLLTYNRLQGDPEGVANEQESDVLCVHLSDGEVVYMLPKALDSVCLAAKHVFRSVNPRKPDTAETEQSSDENSWARNFGTLDVASVPNPFAPPEDEPAASPGEPEPAPKETGLDESDEETEAQANPPDKPAYVPPSFADTMSLHNPFDSAGPSASAPAVPKPHTSHKSRKPRKPRKPRTSRKPRKQHLDFGSAAPNLDSLFPNVANPFESIAAPAAAAAEVAGPTQAKYDIHHVEVVLSLPPHTSLASWSEDQVRDWLTNLGEDMRQLWLLRLSGPKLVRASVHSLIAEGVTAKVATRMITARDRLLAGYNVNPKAAQVRITRAPFCVIAKFAADPFQAKAEWRDDMTELSFEQLLELHTLLLLLVSQHTCAKAQECKALRLLYATNTRLYELVPSEAEPLVELLEPLVGRAKELPALRRIMAWKAHMLPPSRALFSAVLRPDVASVAWPALQAVDASDAAQAWVLQALYAQGGPMCTAAIDPELLNAGVQGAVDLVVEIAQVAIDIGIHTMASLAEHRVLITEDTALPLLRCCSRAPGGCATLAWRCLTLLRMVGAEQSVLSAPDAVQMLSHAMSGASDASVSFRTSISGAIASKAFARPPNPSSSSEFLHLFWLLQHTPLPACPSQRAAERKLVQAPRRPSQPFMPAKRCRSAGEFFTTCLPSDQVTNWLANPVAGTLAECLVSLSWRLLVVHRWAPVAHGKRARASNLLNRALVPLRKVVELVQQVSVELPDDSSPRSLDELLLPTVVLHVAALAAFQGDEETWTDMLALHRTMARTSPKRRLLAADGEIRPLQNSKPTEAICVPGMLEHLAQPVDPRTHPFFDTVREDERFQLWLADPDVQEALAIVVEEHSVIMAQLDSQQQGEAEQQGDPGEDELACLAVFGPTSASDLTLMLHEASSRRPLARQSELAEAQLPGPIDTCACTWIRPSVHS